MFFDEPLKFGKRLPTVTAAAKMPSFTPQFLTREECEAIPAGEPFAFDLEVYRNYFVASFEHIESGKCVSFELSPDHPELDKLGLAWLLWRSWLIGFNSMDYDLPILIYALCGASTGQIKEMSDAIILEDMRGRDLYKRFEIEIPPLNHTDLIEVAPLGGSLKLYAARLHAPRLQGLPFDPHKVLTRDEASILKLYNIVDLRDTSLLFKELRQQIQLREALGKEYRQDLRSHSDAQIAEAVIVSELAKLTGHMPRRPRQTDGERIAYQPPPWLAFQAPGLRALLERVAGAHFELDGAGRATIPPEIAGLNIELGRSVYRLGIGGLHSCEKTAAHIADESTRLLDRDVASYYPAIILNQGLFPKHLGPDFLMVYRGLVDKRLRAKKAGDKVIADSLKITINGSFGKLGSPYSVLYSPDLMLQVTITGQLALLMLIEMIELSGVPVVSGNTDGIIIKCPVERYSDVSAVVREWERLTGFETEETEYKAVYSRDVNNYIAVKLDGSCKVKGVYSEKGSALNSILSKNPESLICSDAVQAMVTKGTPLVETIQNCKDVRRFVTVRNVKGGAVWNGEFLGKVVRYYYSATSRSAIHYTSSGNKVANSDRCRPLMDLPEALPEDLDFERYADIAQEMLFDIGFFRRPETATLF